MRGQMTKRRPTAAQTVDSTHQTTSQAADDDEDNYSSPVSSRSLAERMKSRKRARSHQQEDDTDRTLEDIDEDSLLPRPRNKRASINGDPSRVYSRESRNGGDERPEYTVEMSRIHDSTEVGSFGYASATAAVARPMQGDMISAVQNGAGPERVTQTDRNVEDGSSDDARDEAAQAIMGLATELVAVEEMSRPMFSRTGILESIHLVNFMSHSNFKLELGPNVNIINGANGSGKSAIVAALQLGLGTKSKDRGANLPAHIKHGEKEALISIRIANHPPEFHGEVSDRYKPDLFGRSIIVERRIMKLGPTESRRSSDYCLKNGEGIVVELAAGVTPFQELASILDHFNIMVDNPAALLTQNYCKQFLVQGRPKDLHKLFMKATMFQVWQEYLTGSEKLGDKLDNLVVLKNEGVREAKKEAEELGRRMQSMKDISALQTRMSELRCLYAWACVTELERDADDFRESCTELAKKIDHEKSRIGDIEAEIEALSIEVEEKQRTSEDIREAMQAAGQEDRKFEERRRFYQREIRKLQNEARQVETHRAEIASQIRALVEGMTKARHEFEKQNENSRIAIPALGELDQKLSALGEKISSMESSLVENERVCRELEEDAERKNTSVRRAQESISSTQKDLLVLGRSTTNHLRRFGPQVFEASGKIDRHAKKFHLRPIGPVGAFISVREQGWAKAIQCCLGNSLLSTFLVHDSHDESILRQLCGNQVSMIQTPLNASKYTVTARHRTNHTIVLDMVDVPLAPVYNAIIDHGDADRQVLLNSTEEIEKIAYREQRNVSVCWTPNGDRAFSRMGSRVFHAGPRNISPLLSSDIRQAVGEKQVTLRKLERELSEAIQARAECRGLLQSRQQHLEVVAHELDSARKENGELMNKQREAEIMAGSSGDEVFNTSSWDEDIAHLTEESKGCDQKISQMNDLIASTKSQLEEATLEHKKQVQDRPDMVTLREELNASVRDFWNNLKASGAEKSTCEAELQSLEKEQFEFRECLEETFAKIKKAESDAKSLHTERLRTDQDINDVHNEMEECKFKIETEKRRHRGVTLEQVERDFLVARTRLLESKNNLDLIREYADLIVDGHQERRGRYDSVLKNSKRSANLQFGKYLARRGNTGELLFNKEDETLQLKVRMGAGGNVSERRTGELGTLSGGERSFATLSFLMALGEAMEIPFRIMDEFDVFMDEANRTAALRMLIGMATEVAHRQFIFLTPLDLPKLTYRDPKSVKVFRLPTPQRRSQ